MLLESHMLNCHIYRFKCMNNYITQHHEVVIIIESLLNLFFNNLSPWVLPKYYVVAI